MKAAGSGFAIPGRRAMISGDAARRGDRGSPDPTEDRMDPAIPPIETDQEGPIRLDVERPDGSIATSRTLSRPFAVLGRGGGRTSSPTPRSWAAGTPTSR